MAGEMARANADAVARALALNTWTLTKIVDAYFEDGQARPVLEERHRQLDSGALDGQIAAQAPGVIQQMFSTGDEDV